MSDVMTTAVSALVLFAFFVGRLTGRAEALEAVAPSIPVARREKRHSRMSVLGLAVGKPNRRRS